MSVSNEYERIKALFEGADENKLQLVDGAILECARIKVELDDLHEIIKESGLMKVNPSNPSLQKELPVSKMIVKIRANYLSYISKLSQELGATLSDDDYDLDEYD